MWVVIFSLPPALLTEITVRLVGETIGPAVQMDPEVLGRGTTRVRLVHPLNAPVKANQRLRVSPSDIITVEYKYERLIGRCRTCFRLGHGG